MTAYNVDLAFDWNSLSPFQTTGMLQAAIYSYSPGNPPGMGSYAILQTEDTLQFTLYDNSTNPPGIATVWDGEISIVPVDGATSYPLSAPPSFSPGRMTPGGSSPIYGDVNAMASPFGSSPFTITAPTPPPVRYLVTVTVTVQMPDGSTGTFTNDPEWIVGGGP